MDFQTKRAIIKEANQIVREHFHNGSYHISGNYWVYLEGCGCMNPKKRTAYLYYKEDQGGDEKRLTFDLVQKSTKSQSTFKISDLEDFLNDNL